MLPVTRRVATARLPAAGKAVAAAMAAPHPSPPASPSLLGRSSRVAHLILSREEPSLARALARDLGLPDVDELMRLGAVHFSLVPPAEPPAAPWRTGPSAAADGAPAQAAGQARAAALARWGGHSRLATPRRIFADLGVPCPAHSYARVHLRPQRTRPPRDGTAGEAPPLLPPPPPPIRILHASAACVVVDKPAGLLVPPAVDNVLDCAAHLAALALGDDCPAAGPPPVPGRWGRGVRARGAAEAAILDALEDACESRKPPALRPVHRLDTGTCGVLVLARTPAFASWWAARQRARTAARDGGGGPEGESEGESEAPPPPPQDVTKIYRCLTLARNPPPLGTHLHWAVTRVRLKVGDGSIGVGNGDGVGSDGGGGGGGGGSGPERTLMFDSRAEAEAALALPGGAGSRHAWLLQRAGGNEAAVARGRAKRCELAVLSARRVARLSARARGAFLPRAGAGGGEGGGGGGGSQEGAGDGGGGWEVMVELRTGRTHQIRAQLAALGCPLAGDGLYGGSGGGRRRPSVEPAAAADADAGADADADADDDDGGGRGDRQSAHLLGLQAAELRVHDPEGLMGAETDAGGWAAFEAGPAWWC